MAIALIVLNCFYGPMVLISMISIALLYPFAGYLQSLFGVYSLRIENIGVRRPPSDDVKIQGIANPNAFRKVFGSA